MKKLCLVFSLIFMHGCSTVIAPDWALWEHTGYYAARDGNVYELRHSENNEAVWMAYQKWCQDAKRCRFVLPEGRVLRGITISDGDYYIIFYTTPENLKHEKAHADCPRWGNDHNPDDLRACGILDRDLLHYNR